MHRLEWHYRKICYRGTVQSKWRLYLYIKH